MVKTRKPVPGRMTEKGLRIALASINRSLADKATPIKDKLKLLAHQERLQGELKLVAIGRQKEDAARTQTEQNGQNR